MVTGLPLTTLTPPALVAVDLVDLVTKVWSDRRVPRQEVIATAGHRSCGKVAAFGGFFPEGLCIRARVRHGWRSTGRSHGPGPWWRPCSCVRSLSSIGIRRGPRRWELLPRGNLGKLVCPLVSGGPVVRGDPADGGLIVSAQDSGAGLHGCDSEALARAGIVRPDSVNGGRGVHKNGVPVAALLSLV